MSTGGGGGGGGGGGSGKLTEAAVRAAALAAAQARLQQLDSDETKQHHHGSSGAGSPLPPTGPGTHNPTGAPAAVPFMAFSIDVRTLLNVGAYEHREVQLRITDASPIYFGRNHGAITAEFFGPPIARRQRRRWWIDDGGGGGGGGGGSRDRRRAGNVRGGDGATTRSRSQSLLETRTAAAAAGGGGGGGVHDHDMPVSMTIVASTLAQTAVVTAVNVPLHRVDIGGLFDNARGVLPVPGCRAFSLKRFAFAAPDRGGGCGFDGRLEISRVFNNGAKKEQWQALPLQYIRLACNAPSWARYHGDRSFYSPVVAGGGGGGGDGGDGGGDGSTGNNSFSDFAARRISFSAGGAAVPAHLVPGTRVEVRRPLQASSLRSVTLECLPSRAW